MTGSLRDNTVRLAPDLEKQFIDLVYQKAGIEIHAHQRGSLARLVDNACNRYQLSKHEDYLSSLHECSGSSCEFKYLADGVSINESYFFRDSNQIDYIKNHFFPELINRKRTSGNRQIRVWSAGCSEGQELYTLAILLHQQLIDLDQWRLYFLGTDISNQVLDTAKSAQYTEWSLRSCNETMRKQFFDEDPKNLLRPFQLKKSLRSQSFFHWMNLTNNPFPKGASGAHNLDVIFCRNVFIYLHKEARQQILRQFYDCLNPGGVLVLGANDPHDSLPCGMVPLKSGCRAYTKKQEVAQPQTHSIGAENAVTANQNFNNNAVTPLVSLQSKKEIRRDNHIDLYRHARASANSGELEKADGICTQLISSDPENISYYSLQAWVYLEMNQLDDAELALRRALFLNPDDVQARFQKALFMLKSQYWQKGRYILHELQSEVSGLREKEQVTGWPELNYGDLKRLLQSKLAMILDK